MITYWVRIILWLAAVLFSLASSVAYAAMPCQTVYQNERHSPSTGSTDYLLSLSGGGYRAMLFHVGALRRLNDAGLLRRLDMVSSVSGGSITAGVLAKSWRKLAFDEKGIATNFEILVQYPLMALANRTIDVPSVLIGFLPFSSVSEQIEAYYDDYLFDGMKLDELEEHPSFVFNATSLQTGEIWHFGKERMGGRKIGWTSTKGVSLSRAVTASSAFPPVLSPVEIDLRDNRDWCDDQPESVGHGANPDNIAAQGISEETKRMLREQLVLVDGGVRDNLGFVAIAKQTQRLKETGRCDIVQMVSDGGATYLPNPTPSRNWMSQTMRIIDIGLSEPDQLRIEALVSDAQRTGRPANNCAPDAAFWSIQRLPKWHREYAPRSADVIEADDVLSVGSISTRLAALEEESQKRIINWGYLSAHYALPFVYGLFNEHEKLAVCNLPFSGFGISTETANSKLCPEFKY